MAEIIREHLDRCVFACLLACGAEGEGVEVKALLSLGKSSSKLHHGPL